MEGDWTRETNTGARANCQRVAQMYPADKVEPRSVNVMAGQIQPTPKVFILNIWKLTTDLNTVD